MTYLLGPFIIVKGLVRKNKYWVLFGFFSVIFIYGINANKISLFIPMFMILIFYLKKWGKDILTSCTFLFSILITSLFWLSDYISTIASVVLMRTFGIAGLLTYQYNEFFSSNAKTFFTQINIINFLSGNSYPYPRALGYMVGADYSTNENYNANANFIATDGIASLGAVGIIIISIIVGLYFAFVRSQVTMKNQLIVGLMYVPFCFIVLNVSFFTSLLSGGFCFLNMYFFLKEANG
ncbi:hypothetical protein [Pelobium manganitolerans]|nr:hypothetical protein [Pelobium manganitolerans]